MMLFPFIAAHFINFFCQFNSLMGKWVNSIDTTASTQVRRRESEDVLLVSTQQHHELNKYKFPTEEIIVLRISILPPIFPQNEGFLVSKFCTLDGNFLTPTDQNSGATACPLHAMMLLQIMHRWTLSAWKYSIKYATIHSVKSIIPHSLLNHLCLWNNSRLPAFSNSYY